MDYYWGTPGLWFGDQQDPGPWFGDQQDWSIPGRVWTPHHPQLPVHGAHVGDADVEVADYDVNYDEIVETNIAEEIFQTAKEAMARIFSVAHHADWQLMPFQGIKETCLILKLTPAYCHSLPPRGDDLEPRAAGAWLAMDELLRQQVAGLVPPLPELVVQELRRLQQNLLDLVVLTCCRFMDQKILQAQGVPALLVSRLEAAFTPMPLHLDLWSRLGNSKYHTFTNGARFSNHNKRHGRGGRGNRPHVEASAASSSGNLDAVRGLRRRHHRGDET